MISPSMHADMNKNSTEALIKNFKVNQIFKISNKYFQPCRDHKLN